VEINRDDPVVAVSRIAVAGPPEAVWSVIADFERWPDWHPDVERMELGGPVEEGTTFKWSTGRLSTITSTLRKVLPPRLIGWTGKAPGLNAIHVWRFEEKDGLTIAYSEESWTGPLARILPGQMQQILQDRLDAGMPHFKAEAERRQAAEPGIQATG